MLHEPCGFGLDVGFFCDKGDRKEANEDAILIKTCAAGGSDVGLFAVSDGVGGMDRGDVASAIAVGALARWWDESLMKMLAGSADAGVILESLDNAVMTADRRILAYSEEAGGSSGATLSLALHLRGAVFVRHVGDSRVYLYKKGEPARMLTEDHSYVAELVKAGKLDASEAGTHPKRNVITRCLGQRGGAEPYKNQAFIEAGDAITLCSDGFYGPAPGDKTEGIVRDGALVTAGEKAAALRLLVGPGQAYDNLSLIVASAVPRRVRQA